MAMETGNMKAKDYVDAPPQAAMDHIGARLSSHLQSLRFVREHLSGVLGRAFGEPTGPGAAGKPKEVRTGSFGAVADQLDDAHDVMSDITTLLARLETLA